MLGGARAQYQLRQAFVFLNKPPLNRPEVFVTFANQKFDEKGKLTDEKTKQFIKQLPEALVAWTRKLGNQKIS
jgi:chromate reductase